MKVLILSTCNSCRCQMAHSFIQSFDSRLKVFSAGTKPAQKLSERAGGSDEFFRSEFRRVRDEIRDKL